jgi:hypothetical protein
MNDGNTPNTIINDDDVNNVRISSSLYASVSNDGIETTLNGADAIDTSESIELMAISMPASQQSVTSNQHQRQQQPNTIPRPSNLPPRNNQSSISLTELNYGVSSYHAIVTPVTCTMIFSALAVTFIQSPRIDTSSSINSMYNAFQISDDYSVGTNLGLSLINALIIVSCVAAATFGLVLLYKFR